LQSFSHATHSSRSSSIRATRDTSVSALRKDTLDGLIAGGMLQLRRSRSVQPLLRCTYSASRQRVDLAPEIESSHSDFWLAAPGYRNEPAGHSARGERAFKLCIFRTRKTCSPGDPYLEA